MSASKLRGKLARNGYVGFATGYRHEFTGHEFIIFAMTKKAVMEIAVSGFSARPCSLEKVARVQITKHRK